MIRHYARKLTEAEFQQQVIQYARLRRWRVAHFAPARVRRGGVETYETPVRADGRGFPDLVLVRRGVVLFRELKTDSGKLTDDQSLWIEALGHAAEVWRPRDWIHIARQLD